MSGPRGAGSGLARYLPAVGWLAGYQGPWLRGDLSAGVTTAAAVASAAGGDPSRALVAASTLAALTGVLLLGAGGLRLGFMADFISAPVLAGFKAGVGLLIAAGQLGKLLGVPQEDGDFFVKVGSALAHLADISWPTFALAAVSIAILLALRRWAP